MPRPVLPVAVGPQTISIGDFFFIDKLFRSIIHLNSACIFRDYGENFNMPFVKKHQKIISKIKSYSLTKLWLNTAVFSIFIFLLGSLYLFARRGSYDLYISNKVLAVTAMILIGFSFALSGLCFFWDFADTKIIYRKYLGLSGFAFALVHITVSLFFLPDRFPFPEHYLEKSNLWSFSFGVSALIIFAMMAAISNRYALHELGGKLWRALLRIGYIAYAFTIIHFGILKYQGWLKWFKTFEPALPPLSLLAVVFSAAVIVLRLALWLAVRKKRDDKQPIS